MQINRDQYLNQMIRYKDNGRIKIITGIRRCGKSYLLFELYKNYLLSLGIHEENIIELALDELQYIKYRNPFFLDEYIRSSITDQSQRYYVFIDEIQFCEDVDNPYLKGQKITFIDTLLGLMKIKNLDIYVTGSNSRMLSRDILTQFRDRGDEIHLYPLSYFEFYNHYPDKRHAWRDYYTFGGMPYLLQLETVEEKSQYLKNLFEETYLKDIIERNRIGNEQEVLEILLDFISSAVGSLTNPSKLENRFRSVKNIMITHNTIRQYLEFFKESYLIEEAKRYDVKGGRYFQTPLKYYYTDIGLRNARLNFRQTEENHLMENIIYNELIRRGFNVDVGVVSFSQRHHQQLQRINLEVDFVANKGNQRYYIQSALSISDPEKRAQEVNSLNRIQDSFRKIVIVKDDIIPFFDESGILYIGIEKFLLDEHAMNL